MAEAKHTGKLVIFIVIAIIAGAAGYGYFNQTATLTEPAAASTPIDTAALAPRPNDIILGDNNAIITMVEYSSLSCPHCAHFHEKILPTLEKEFITTGKMKLVVRHFPLNEPAIKASELVECAGNNGLKRENFMKVLFDMQNTWAFGQTFLKDLKQIALVGGIDSAAFDSCVNDKELETRILTMRQTAEDKLGVKSTPSFFINGELFKGEPSVDGFRKALTEAAGEPAKTESPAPAVAAPVKAAAPQAPKAEAPEAAKDDAQGQD